MNELLWYNQGIHSGLITNQDKNNLMSLKQYIIFLILDESVASKPGIETINRRIRISSTVLNYPIMNPKIRMRCLMVMILKWHYVYEINSIIQPYGDRKINKCMP